MVWFQVEGTLGLRCRGFSALHLFEGLVASGLGLGVGRSLVVMREFPKIWGKVPITWGAFSGSPIFIGPQKST